MDNQQGPTVQHRELCSVLCGSLDGGEFEGEWIQVCIWLSPFTVHLKLTTLLIGYTPIQNKKLFKNKWKTKDKKKYIAILTQKKIMNHNRRSTENSKDGTATW